MNNEEKIRYYVKKELVKKAQEFTDPLTNAELKELRPVIKELCKDLLTYQQLNKNTWGTKGTSKQYDILNHIGVYCLTKADFKKYCNIWHFERDYFKAKEIIETGKVSWLLNHIAKNHWYSYLELMDAKCSGYFEPEREELATSLANTISDYDYNAKPRVTYTPKNLEIHPESITEHIWYLFEYETNINHQDDQRYRRQEDTFDEPVWKYTFKQLIEKGKIDRIRLLKECLLTSNRNFNKVLSGWFYDLMLYLEPNNEEFIELQPELFNALSSQHSKIVNGVLKEFKKLYAHESFETQDFLDNTDFLLSSETKSIAVSTLMIFDKLVKKDKNLKDVLVEKSLMAFNSTFKDVQLRAAKFIAKYGDESNENLKDELSLYASDLFSESKAVLAEFISEEDQDALEENLYYEPVINVAEETRISELNDIDDLIYLASQSFDNNEPYHFDLLLQGLLDFQETLKEEENKVKLEPAIQRAFNLLMKGSNSQTGNLDKILANFFINYVQQILLTDKSETSIKFQKRFKKEKEEDDAYAKRSEWYNPVLVDLRKWKFRSHHKGTYHLPFLNILIFVFDLLREGKHQQLLSTPSHAPFWIEPLVLVERLIEYQQKNHTIFSYDLCLAIARCSMNETDTKPAYDLVQKELKGELKELMTYLLDKSAKFPELKNYEQALYQAYFNKKDRKEFEKIPAIKSIKKAGNYLGDIDYKVEIETYDTTDWDYKLRKSVPVQRQRKNLEIKEVELKDGLIDKLKMKRNRKQVTYDFINFGDYFYDDERNDLPRIISMFPNNSEIVFSRLVSRCFGHDWWEVNEEKIGNKIFEILMENPQNPLEAGHLMIACSLFAKPKSVKAYAAEYWSQLVSRDAINSNLIGEIIAKFQYIEYYPLKRFTDLINEQMMNLSQKHNTALLNTIEAAIPLMNNKPIKNTKKLLELYNELRLKACSNSLSEKVNLQLENWKSSGTLKKIIKQIQTA